MSKKEKKDSKNGRRKDDPTDNKEYLQDETIRAIVAVAFFVFAVFLLLSSGPLDMGGFVGRGVYGLFHKLFGIGYYLMPLIFLLLSVSFFRSIHKKLALTHSIGGLLFFLSSLALINITSEGSGGMVSGYVSGPLISLFNTPMTVVILVALVIVSIKQ